MITARLKSLVREQRGFTLIELLIAVAITALVTGAIATTIYQVITGNAQSSNHITAVRQVQNAGYWITRDGQQAQVIDDSPSGADEFLILTWNNWTEGEDHQVTYTIVGNDLRRRIVVVNLATGNTISDTEFIVARFVDTGNTSVTLNGNVLALTVTATVSDFPRVVSETREYQIVPRPSL
jgi:prepilin-type N-terminal cleavage/methylation domain-containing protein